MSADGWTRDELLEASRDGVKLAVIAPGIVDCAIVAVRQHDVVVTTRFGATAYVQFGSVRSTPPRFAAGDKVATPYGAGVVTEMRAAAAAAGAEGARCVVVKFLDKGAVGFLRPADVHHRTQLLIDEALEAAEELRSQGNAAFKAGDFEAAIGHYEAVPGVLGLVDVSSRFLGAPALAALREQAVKACGNAAQAYLSLDASDATAASPLPRATFTPHMRVQLARLGLPESVTGEMLSRARMTQVVKHCSDGLEMDEANATGSRDKLRYRRGVALVALGAYERAIADLIGLPDAPSAAKLREAKVGAKRAADKEKKLWSAAFGSPPPAAAMAATPAAARQPPPSSALRSPSSSSGSGSDSSATPAAPSMRSSVATQPPAAATVAVAAAGTAQPPTALATAATASAPLSGEAATAVAAGPMAEEDANSSGGSGDSRGARGVVRFLDAELESSSSSSEPQPPQLQQPASEPLAAPPTPPPAAAAASRHHDMDSGSADREREEAGDDAAGAVAAAAGAGSDSSGGEFRRTFVGRTPHPSSKLGASLSRRGGGVAGEEEDEEEGERSEAAAAAAGGGDEEGGQRGTAPGAVVATNAAGSPLLAVASGSDADLALRSSVVNMAAAFDEAAAAPAPATATAGDTQTLLATKDQDHGAGLSPLLLVAGAAVLGVAAIGAMVYLRRR